MNVDTSAIFLPDGAGDKYRAIVALGDIAEVLQETYIEPGVGIIGTQLKSGIAEFVNNTNNDPRAVQIAGTVRKIRND